MCPVFSLLSRLSGCIATYYDASTSCVPPDSLSLESEGGWGAGGNDVIFISENEITLGFVMF